MLSHKINQRLSSQMFDAFVLSNVADVYYLLNKPDTALFYIREAWEKYTNWEREVAFTLVPLKSAIIIGMGNVYSLMGKKDTALQFYHDAIFTSASSYDRITSSRVHAKIAELYESLHQYDSSLYYARLAHAIAKSVAQKFDVLGASELLVRLHKKSNNLDSAFYYQNVVVAMKDSLYGAHKFKQLQLLMLEEQEQQQETLQEQERYKNRMNLIALWSAVGVFLVIALILFRLSTFPFCPLTIWVK
jgi:tetratricopeptide (TPR) repeat protein